MHRRRRRWELQDLDPEWLQVESPRYNVGFSFDCPYHGTHRLIVRFQNPYDGFELIGGPGVVVVMIANGSFDEVTLESATGSDVLHFPSCGRLRIIDGRVEIPH